MNRKFFLLCLVFSLGSATAAERVYMPFFELINVHSDYQYSMARLFKAYVDEQGKYQMVIPARSDTGAQPSADSIREEAKRRDCPYYLIGDMNRISENVIVTVALYSTADGAHVWGDKLKAAGPGDLDPIFQKLARTVGTPRKANEDGDIYSVTRYEERNLRQTEVRNSFGLAIGGALFTTGLLTGKGWNDPFAGGLGVVWAYDARTVLFEVDAQNYALGQNSGLGMISISAFKPVVADKVTPFYGGGLGLGFAETEYQGERTSGKGLMAHVGGGIILNRTSSVQLRLQARYVLGLFQVDSPRHDIPQAILARMELTFGN